MVHKNGRKVNCSIGFRSEGISRGVAVVECYKTCAFVEIGCIFAGISAFGENILWWVSLELGCI
jgi:hypothetical protein